MKKVSYINTMPFEYDPINHKRSPYRPIDCEGYRNRGELLESMAKWHRGVYTTVNPNTSYCTGSDIESEHASVKSSEGSLGRNIGGHTASASTKIKVYFKTVHSTIFIWIEYDPITQIVTEYQMNKYEFGAFVQRWTRICNNSEHTELAIRFKKTSKSMINWLEERCA